MDGFDDAVNGWYDVDDRVAQYLRSRAAPQFASERATKAAIDSRRAFEQRRADVREQFLAGIGGLPSTEGDPAVTTTGRIERDGYEVELLTFETWPGVHATANCYVPEGEGPFPGVLFLCGHVESPKADAANQRACIDLALNGFVVLIVDPIAQGERTQYVDAETGEPVFSGSGGVFAHCYAGQKCFYAGTTLARYMIHDDRRALACLAARPDVDSNRLAVTGTSGGGIRTLYLALVDDRPAAVAPCCGVTERREWLKTGKRVDAEQVVYGAIPRGINYDDLVTGLAPAPVCIGAAASDQYFPIEGVHETVERARRVYDLYDAADRLTVTVADTTHCAVYDLRDGVFPFLCDTLGDAAYVPHDDPPTLDAAELACTPAGSVLKAYPDERTIEDLIRADVAERAPDAPDVDAADLRERLLARLGHDPEGCELHPRVIEQTTADGLRIDHVWFRTERDPDAVVTGVRVTDPEATTRSPAVVLYADGTEELPDRTEDVRALAREYGAVLVFDPRGVGAVRNRAIPIPAWVDGYDDIYGTEFKLAYDALLLGSSLFGMRVYDVTRAVAFLRESTGAEAVSFVGEGSGAYHALYAAAAVADVTAVEVRDACRSFADRAIGSDVPFRPRLTVFDVVETCDVPHVTAALEQRGVEIDRP